MVNCTANAIRIVIAAQQPLFREGLRKLLEAEPDLTVAGEARDVEEAVELVQQLQPHVLLLDLAGPHEAGILTLRRINATGAHVRTILLTFHINRHEIVSALQLGARGVVMKVSTPELLLRAIRAVMEGHYWIGVEPIADLLDTFRELMSEAPHADSFGLTSRELRIVAMVAAGRTNRKIAESLSISEDTVKHHLTAIFDKVGVSSRLGLAVFARHHQLLDQSS